MNQYAIERLGLEADDNKYSVLMYSRTVYFDYVYLIGDLLYSKCNTDDFMGLFDVFDENRREFFNYCLCCFKKYCNDYIARNDFSKSFFQMFTNSKLITFTVRMVELGHSNFQPLKLNSAEDSIHYMYESEDIKSIIFSSMHFALENGYKFTQCSHCGRWFFKPGSRSGSRKKYCNRNSIFNGYEHLECEQAVRNINQELQRKKKRIYNSMIRENLSTEQCVYNFLDQCREYAVSIREKASVQNLSDYWEFLTHYRDRSK